MATNTFVELNLPEAADVADLTGVHYDLESAKDLALKLRAMVSAGRTCDFSLVDALSTAILVRYSRAFVKGVADLFNKMLFMNFPIARGRTASILSHFVIST